MSTIPIIALSGGIIGAMMPAIIRDLIPEKPDKFHLHRFISAQDYITPKDDTYKCALEEIRNGKKCGHWIWYIFPQLKGLGYSSMCEVYSIRCFEEAQAYWANRTLSRRLRKITKALLTHKDKTAVEIFGPTDALKVRSCMTLFDLVKPNDIFAEVLNQFYEGKPCEKTLAILQQMKEQ